MRKFILCLSMIIASVFSTQAEILKVDTSTAEAQNITIDDAYIVSTAYITLESDFTFEGTLSLYAGGSLSVDAIYPIVSNVTLNGRYLKFTISAEIIEGVLFRNKTTYYLPVGRAGNGQSYYIRMNLVN